MSKSNFKTQVVRFYSIHHRSKVWGQYILLYKLMHLFRKDVIKLIKSYVFL